jgi:hypothetical protein
MGEVTMSKGNGDRFLYTGCFLAPTETGRLFNWLGGRRLNNVVDSPHVTLAFLPDVLCEHSIGTEVLWNVVGYGNDGQNEGVLVELAQAPDELLDEIALRREHHVTLSLADGAHAKDTAKLEFTPVEPLSITTIYGLCTCQGTIVIKHG